MLFLKQDTTNPQSNESPSQKNQAILFFKSYLRYLKCKISNNATTKEYNLTIFDLKKTSVNVSLQIFLSRVFSYFNCGTQAYICALSFIDRLLASQSAKNVNMVVSIKNIFKILSVALLIATKNFDDFYYSNAYYARVCGLTLLQFNTLEKQFLKMMDFNVFIDSQQYKVYEKKINMFKLKLLDQMELTQRNENLIDEKNKSLIEKTNNLILRKTCYSLGNNDTIVQVQVAG